MAAEIEAEVVYAVNCGGGEHVDSNGIYYSDDPLVDEGIASDYGKLLFVIGRVPPADRVSFLRNFLCIF